MVDEPETEGASQRRSHAVGVGGHEDRQVLFPLLFEYTANSRRGPMSPDVGARCEHGGGRGGRRAIPSGRCRVRRRRG